MEQPPQGSSAHPRSPFAGHPYVRKWHLYTLALIAVVAAVALGVGYHMGQNNTPYNAAYFAQRVVLNQPHIPRNALLDLHAISANQPHVSAPAQSQAYIPASEIDAPLDQGQVGQCQCYAFRVQWEHLIRKRLGHPLHYSCLFWYSIVGEGKDLGSRIEQYTSLLSSVGGVFHSIYDYHGSPTPSQLDYPTAQTYISAATGHRYPVVSIPLSPNGAGSVDAVNNCQRQILSDRTCNVGIPVFSGAPECRGVFDVNSNDGNVDIPALPNCQIIGYHAVTARGYDHNHCALGTCGYELMENSWGAHYGVNCKTGQPDTQHGGCFWMSDRYIEQYGYLMTTLKLVHQNPQAVKPQPFTQAGPALDRPLPPPPPPAKVTAPPPPGSNSRAWVIHVYAHDTGEDMARYIDQRATQVGISPVGMLAVIGAECGLYTKSTRCDRLGGGADYSFGCCQITIQTAHAYGIGSGYFDGYYGYNTSYVRNYEDVTTQGVYLAGSVLGDYAADERRNCPGAADFPNLYVAWNAGPYNPCWFLMNPTGLAGSNYYNNFLGWMRWAYGFVYYSPTNPYTTPAPRPQPKPKPFPVSHWGSKPYRLPNGHPNWAATHYQTWLGRFKREVYVHGRRPRGAYMHYVFGHGSEYCWFASGRCKLTHG